MIHWCRSQCWGETSYTWQHFMWWHDRVNLIVICHRCREKTYLIHLQLLIKTLVFTRSYIIYPSGYNIFRLNAHMEKDRAYDVTSAKATGTNLSATPLKGVASTVPLTVFTQTFLCLNVHWSHLPISPSLPRLRAASYLRISCRPTTSDSFFEVQSSRLDFGSLDKSLAIISVGCCCEV